MSPRGRGPRRPHGPPGQDENEQLPWSIVYYQAPDGSVPALEFLDGCPGTIDAQFTAVLDAVAAAPPPRFSGGGKWEAMHGTMGGWYEIRLTGPGREQLRLFCLLENGTTDELAKRGLPRPAIAVITGMRKPWRTVFSERDYHPCMLNDVESALGGHVRIPCDHQGALRRRHAPRHWSGIQSSARWSG